MREEVILAQNCGIRPLRFSFFDGNTPAPGIAANGGLTIVCYRRAPSDPGL